MVLLITGGTHTGKTKLAQSLMEKYGYPYLSMDHLKMGLIRSGNTLLSPVSSATELTGYLWPIVREMIKTNIENEQNIIIEGMYIPFDYRADFMPGYLKHIKSVCLIFSRNYIKNHYPDILTNGSVIEKRIDNSCPAELLIEENERNLKLCIQHGWHHILIKDTYEINAEELFPDMQ